VAKVPISDIYFLPRRFTAVSEQGQAYFLRVRQDEAQIVPLAFKFGYEDDLANRWAESL